MARRKRYSDDELHKAAIQSVSIAGVCRKLGIALTSSSMQTHIKCRLDRAGIDTSHFIGRASNRGKKHRGGPARLHWRKILVLNRLNGRKEPTHRLRDAMLEAGIPQACAFCGMKPNWQGKPLVLQIEHKNGDRLDNRRRNIALACPNCHSQTPTHSKNKYLKD